MWMLRVMPNVFHIFYRWKKMLWGVTLGPKSVALNVRPVALKAWASRWTATKDRRSTSQRVSPQPDQLPGLLVKSSTTPRMKSGGRVDSGWLWPRSTPASTAALCPPTSTPDPLLCVWKWWKSLYFKFRNFTEAQFWITFTWMRRPILLKL